MPQVSLTPTDVPVLPRNREYDIARSLARNWFDNHPFKTAWFNAMSITFPLGEKFFIDSVRYFANRIEDPKLNEDIRGFCGQEGFHRREHQRRYHDDRVDAPAERIERRQDEQADGVADSWPCRTQTHQPVIRHAERERNAEYLQSLDSVQQSRP